MLNKLAVDLKKVKPENKEEKIFFELLLKFKKVIYDWGADVLWVLENWEDRKTPENFHPLTGTDFIHRTEAYAATAADLIVVFFYNEIDVEVINCLSTFKTEEEKEESINFYRKTAEEQRKKS